MHERFWNLESRIKSKSKNAIKYLSLRSYIRLSQSKKTKVNNTWALHSSDDYEKSNIVLADVGVQS